MRILITADPYLPVPPKHYGGIERIVDCLARELVGRGHEVTLLAHPDSQTAGRLIGYGAPPHSGWRCRSTELWQVGRVLWGARQRVDLVHSFGRLAALLPILPLRSLPKVQSYQRPISWTGVAKAVALGGDSIHFTACSAAMFNQAAAGIRRGRWNAIFNGVDLDIYTPRLEPMPDAPLAFLGRLEPIKGVHSAIAIARATGRQLVIAGNRVSTGDNERYFAEQIEPHLDGEQIRYVGPVDDQEKNTLLRSSAALLMPIEWDEPFGIVMAEALACGTPVIGMRRGSVPEVVRHGETGFVVDTVEEAASAVGQLAGIDRAMVRADCEQRFSQQAITDAYEALYLSVLGR